MDNQSSTDAAKMAADIRRYRGEPPTSALPPPEPQGHCERSRLATCSLPVSSVEMLCGLWGSAALARDAEARRARREGNIDEVLPLENAADAYRRCVQMLRAEMEAANKRQPEENHILSHSHENPRQP